MSNFHLTLKTARFFMEVTDRQCIFSVDFQSEKNNHPVILQL